MKVRSILLLLTVFILTFACTTKEAKQEKQIEEDTEALSKDARKIMPNLPSPNEYAAILHSTGAEFNPMILNDPANLPGYTTRREKAVANLGVYFFDLGYCVAFQDSEFVSKYYDVSHNLSLQLGIEKSFMEVMMTRYKENIDANDSLKAYFKDTYSKAAEELGSTEEESTYYRTIFLAGFYIEGMFNMLEVIESYPKDILPDDQRFVILMPVVKSVLSQKDNVKKLAEMLEINVKGDDDDDYYATSFRDLINTYEKLDVDDKIANNKGSELLNDGVMLELMSKVDMIRSEVVKRLD